MGERFKRVLTELDRLACDPDIPPEAKAQLRDSFNSTASAWGITMETQAKAVEPQGDPSFVERLLENATVAHWLFGKKEAS